jgi:3D (Asp-Asp-Asp) domain-containing protein
MIQGVGFYFRLLLISTIFVTVLALPNPVFTTLWHAGNFRYLDAESGQLLVDVGNLAHPAQGGYGRVSTTRRDKFNLLLDALFAAINDSIVDGNTGDWCDVKVKAANAGYDVIRYYDTDSGRWFVHGRDRTSFGQSYFYINPFAKRNIVIEVPHEPSDSGTAVQGARIFKDLAARALIINKEERCSDPDEAIQCDHGTASACADGRVRESDVAHNTDNTFHLLHVRFSNMDAGTRFVQLHGFRADRGRQNAVVGDSSNRDVGSSVSNTFVSYLRGKISSPSSVSSCQESAGDPNPSFCGEANAQGRYTNNGDACTFTSATSGRFLHVEQAPSLRDDDESDGMSWKDISDSLKLTLTNIYMNNGATDDTLGLRQTQYGTLSCPTQTTTMNVKVTFYSFPDNEDGFGNFGTNVIAYHQVWQGQGRPTNTQGDPIASGTGTFANPITVAAAQGSSLLPPGTLVYVTGLKKYLLVEDSCGNCTSAWIDVWMESNAGNDPSVVSQCENNWTRDPGEIQINPPSGLVVDTTPFFDTIRNQCNPVTW